MDSSSGEDSSVLTTQLVPLNFLRPLLGNFCCDEVGEDRLCGDFKVTLNPVMAVDQYPLPKPQDLYATLSGGKKFTKLDLSQAYLQLMLDDQSQSLVVINTHKGLYKFTRLPFGVASAPAMFQKLMDTILQGNVTLMTSW